ncbi:MAG: M50 family metallopeptidase [Bacillota bacterium]
MSGIILSIIVIGGLVLVHEYGHYIVAKKAGIWVEEFAIGMGPKLFGKEVGETLYTIRLLPLGGFCRMHGETEDGEISERSFLSKSVLARFLVMGAGVFMNVVIAFVLLFILTVTTYMATPVFDQVVEDSAVAEAGFEEGDKIVKMNGKRILIYDELRMELAMNYDAPVDFTFIRDGATYEKTVTPKLDEESGRYLVGIVPEFKSGMFMDEVEGVAKAGFMETVSHSFNTMIYYVKATAEGLLRVFTFQAETEEFGGPITIVQTVGQSYEAGLTYGFWAGIQNVMQLAAMLSANLAVLNLFPIPGLDGGRMIFLIIEGIRKKPISMEIEGKITMIGFTFMLGLMVFVMYTDVVKLFGGS